MNFIYSAEDLHELFKTLMSKHKKYLWITPFAKSTFPFVFDLADNEHKIEKICIGFNGLDTSPTFINEFFDYKQLKFFNNKLVPNTPNLFLFLSSDQQWDMLSGSLYLNKSSFEQDPQMIFHITSGDDSGNEILNGLLRNIDYVWDRSFKISEDEYEDYWERWSKELSTPDQI